MNEFDFTVGVVAGGLVTMGLLVAIRLMRRAISAVQVKIGEMKVRTKNG